MSTTVLARLRAIAFSTSRLAYGYGDPMSIADFHRPAELIRMYGPDWS